MNTDHFEVQILYLIYVQFIARLDDCCVPQLPPSLSQLVEFVVCYQEVIVVVSCRVPHVKL